MSAHRWWWRLGGGTLLFVVLEVVFVAVRFEPDAVRLALLVAVGVAGAGLVVDSLGDSGPTWDLEVARPATPQGQDPRTARYLRVLESHLTSRTPDGALRDRIGTLTDLVLRQRHGVGRDDPAARTLMGPDLAGVLDGPPRRLSRDEIDRCVTRIEEL